MAGNADCVFCEIVAGRLPAHKIYEDADTLAFLDIADDADGHTLVIPKSHSVDIVDAEPGALQSVMSAVGKVSRHYVNRLKFDGVNVLNASGEAAEQSVPHLHFHIIPRRSDDGLRVWPALPGGSVPLAEMRERLALPADA